MLERATLAERESLKCKGVKEPGQIGYSVHELCARSDGLVEKTLQVSLMSQKMLYN